MAVRTLWTLNKLLVFTLLGGFVLLLVEVRAAHQPILGGHPIAWMPIVFSGLMVLLGLASLLGWEKGGRRLLFWGFAVSVFVGALGVWIHNDGHPLKGLMNELSAWTQPLDSNAKQVSGEDHGTDRPREHQADASNSGPPALAPLALFGLGLLGMLTCAGRFQPHASDPTEKDTAQDDTNAA